MSRGGGYDFGKQLGVSLSMARLSQSVSSLAEPPFLGPGRKAHSSGLVDAAVPGLLFVEKGQEAPDQSILTRWARHPSCRRGALWMGPPKVVLSARYGRCARSVLSDHLDASRPGMGRKGVSRA